MTNAFYGNKVFSGYTGGTTLTYTLPGGVRNYLVMAYGNWNDGGLYIVSSGYGTATLVTINTWVGTSQSNHHTITISGNTLSMKYDSYAGYWSVYDLSCGVVTY